MGDDIFALSSLVEVSVVVAVSSEQVVEFLNQTAYGRYELDKSLGDDDSTIVLATSSACSDDGTYLVDDLVEGEVSLLHLFRDEADIWLALQGTFEGDMRSRATHNLDEVPVFACRVAVALNVTYEFSISLSGGVEAERSFNLFVLQVAVNGLGASDDLYAHVLCCVVFCEHACVGVRVVATDDDDSLDIELAYDFQAFFKLVFLFKFGTSRAYHVETSGIAVVVDEFSSEFHVVVVYESAGTHEEAIEFVLGIKFLHGVEESGDDVVSAGSLSAAEYDTHVHGFMLLFLTLYKLHEGHAIGVWEEFLYLFLVVYALGGFTLFHLHWSLERLGQFWLVGGSGLLQCTFFSHFLIFCKIQQFFRDSTKHTP